jgi:hypothetical protein
MTVIAWDGKTLAADKRGDCCGFALTLTKVCRFSNGHLGAGCGNSHDIRELLAWYEAGAKPESFPARQKGERDGTSALVVIQGDGTPLHFDGGPYPIRIENKFFAAGSGRDYAIAAMHYGKTAHEAVALASLYDLGCGNGIDTLELEL